MYVYVAFKAFFCRSGLYTTLNPGNVAQVLKFTKAQEWQDKPSACLGLGFRCGGQHVNLMHCGLTWRS